MNKLLTALVLVSASTQTAWAAAAEQHWVAMPLLLALVGYGTVCAYQSLRTVRRQIALARRQKPIVP
jgi:hypothetical protein